MEARISAYKNDRVGRAERDRDPLAPSGHREAKENEPNRKRGKDSPDKVQGQKDPAEEDIVSLMRSNKRLEERVAELGAKFTNSEKSWKAKIEAKELEISEEKSKARNEFYGQINALRKENNQLKLSNSELTARL